MCYVGTCALTRYNHTRSRGEKNVKEFLRMAQNHSLFLLFPSLYYFVLSVAISPISKFVPLPTRVHVSARNYYYVLLGITPHL